MGDVVGALIAFYPELLQQLGLHYDVSLWLAGWR